MIYMMYTYDIRYERGPVGIFIEGGVEQNDPSGRNLSLWSGRNSNCQNPHNENIISLQVAENTMQYYIVI